MRHRSSCSSDYGLFPLNGQHQPLLASTHKPPSQHQHRHSYNLSCGRVRWDECANSNPDPLPGPGDWEYPRSAVLSRRSQVPSPHHIGMSGMSGITASEADFVGSDSDDVETSITSSATTTSDTSMRGQAHTGAFVGYNAESQSAASERISALCLDRQDDSEETDVDEDGDGIFLNAMGGVVSQRERECEEEVTDAMEDREQRLRTMNVEFEDRLEAMSAKMEALNLQVRQLTQKNEELEASKLSLLSNTANALNEYRDTVRKLNRQNATLVRWATSQSQSTRK